MLDFFVYAYFRKLERNEWDALSALVAGNQIQNIFFPLLEIFLSTNF